MDITSQESSEDRRARIYALAERALTYGASLVDVLDALDALRKDA